MTVYEVGPRDGLQNEPDVIAPGVRAELVRRGCSRTGSRGFQEPSLPAPVRIDDVELNAGSTRIGTRSDERDLLCRRRQRAGVAIVRDREKRRCEERCSEERQCSSTHDFYFCAGDQTGWLSRLPAARVRFRRPPPSAFMM